MKKILILVIWLGLWQQASAQNVINPINKLVKTTYENKMFSHRLLKDYVLIKNNIYQNRVMSDIDNTLARYDENLLYIAQFVEKNKDTKKKFINLQLFWNDYRILFIDYDNTDLNKLIKYTENFTKYNDDLALSTIETNNLNNKYKKELESLDILSDLNNQIDQLLINYYLNSIAKSKIYKVDIKSIQKNIKKLHKTKIGKSNPNIIEDLKNTLSVIESLLSSENSAKQMYSNVNYFTKKNFIMMNKILAGIKE